MYASRRGMILDILTILFLILSLVLIAWMIGDRRRDVLHGPYVTHENITPRKSTPPPPPDAVAELSRIVRDIEQAASSP